MDGSNTMTAHHQVISKISYGEGKRNTKLNTKLALGVRSSSTRFNFTSSTFTNIHIVLVGQHSTSNKLTVTVDQKGTHSPAFSVVGSMQ